VLPGTDMPPITIAKSHGVDQQLRLGQAQAIASALVHVVPVTSAERLTLWLERGKGQSGPTAVASVAGRTYRFTLGPSGWTLLRNLSSPPPVVRALPGYRLVPIRLPFTQGSFRYGMSSDPTAMMGGGVCWLDANGDGRLDLFAVNGYDDPHFASYKRVPRSVLYLNEGGNRFRAAYSIAVKGEGCVAGDLDGDGRPDLVVTTATDDVLLWNEGGGRFREAPQSSGFHSFLWHAGAAIADVNGDGRPDLYLAGYTNMNVPIESSLRGFPRDHEGVRDELFLNLGGRRFKEVGAQVGLDRPPYDHSLGAEFMDVNHDGRMDLFVANDEDANKLYLNEPGGRYGFHFVNVAARYGVADRNAGMGVATANGYLFVSNSRGQTHAVYDHWRDVRKSFANAFGTNLTGWGDSWIDLRNTGTPQLLLANGAIPVTSLKRDAAELQMIASVRGRWVNGRLLQGLDLNGRGLAAADYDNDGRVDVAIGTIGGHLLLLHNTSPGTGNWLTVNVEPFSPGATVTVTDSSGRTQTRVVTAGSSYLSSEDPRVHFGFGKATPLTLTVTYPNGKGRTVKAKPDTIQTVTRS
jgi:hypothetical protein